MSTSLIAGGVATVITVIVVVSIAGLSLLSGAFHFLFAKPRIVLLKPRNRETGFAFGFSWNSAREPAKFDKVKVRLFNPFGKPTQVEVSKEFPAKDMTFAEEVDFGHGFKQLLNAEGIENSLIQIELSALKDGITQQIEMKGRKFLRLLGEAKESVDQYAERNKIVYDKPLYFTAERSFIADPLPESDRVLKLPTNPAFAAELAAMAGGGAAADAGPAAENFTVKKVWIDPGCIVCDACEAIYPEVFEVTDDSCIIRPGAPLDNGLLIQEAAEACPVEVIKFDRA